MDTAINLKYQLKIEHNQYFLEIKTLKIDVEEKMIIAQQKIKKYIMAQQKMEMINPTDRNQVSKVKKELEQAIKEVEEAKREIEKAITIFENK